MQFRKDVTYRKQLLIRLLEVIIGREDDIIAALEKDFGKPGFETVLTEIALVESELKDAIRKIGRRASRKMVLPNPLNFPSLDFIYPEPYGDVLIISPWNYPFLLAMTPLISAVAAGNSVVLKPSELTPNTASIIELIIAEVFDPTHVEVFQGGPEVSRKLVARRWDYIFFTGSLAVGKQIAKAAAEHLTPVTLELGGKNPCIVDQTANIQLAAKRIAWGKFINAGQTCIAPDYLLVHQSVKKQLIEALKVEITAAYGEDVKNSKDFARIISEPHFERLANMIDATKVVFGGQLDRADRFVSPTIIDEPASESGLMADEIFGPILPIIGYRSEEDIAKMIQKYEKPLSLYVFSSNRAFARQIIKNYSFGGGCINDTMIHFSNNRLPFGGVGHSGYGSYHGDYGFRTFSHYKSVTRKATWLDITLRYAPYDGKFNLLRKVLKWF